MRTVLAILLITMAPARAVGAQRGSAEAAAELERFLKAFPDDTEGLNRLVYQYDLLNKPDAAILALTRYLKRHPEDLSRGKDLGYRLLKQKRFEDADALYGRLLKSRPADKKLWWEAIHGFEDAKRSWLALKWLVRYRKRYPDDPEGIDLEVHLRLSLNRKKAAAKALRAYVERNPKDAKRSEYLASLLSETGQKTASVEILERLVKLKPEDESRWWNLIYALVERKRHSEAASYLEHMLERFPENRKAFDELAYLYEIQGKQKRSLKTLARALEKRPADEKTATQLVERLIATQRYSEADPIVGRFRQASPDSALWMAFEAQLHSLQGRPLEAARAYQHILQNSPDEPGLLIKIGAIFLGVDDFFNAVRMFRKAHELSPNTPDAAYYLSETYYGDSRPFEGRRWAKRALALLPDKNDDPFVLRRRLRLQSRLRWNRSIEKKYETLLKRFPKELDLYVNFLDGLIGRRRYDKAERILSEMVVRFPEERRQASLFRYYMADGRGEFDEAIRALSGYHARNPGDFTVSLPLAESYLFTRRWPEASEILCRHYDNTDKPHCYAMELHYQTHARHDHRIRSGARLYEFPGDVSVEARAGYGGQITRYFRLEAEVIRGSYRSGPLFFRGQGNVFETRWAYERFHPWLFGVTGEASQGLPRNSASPGAFIDWQPRRWLNASASYRHRALWNDFARPVAAGALQDEIRAQINAIALPRLSTRIFFERDDYRLDDGARANWRAVEGAIGLSLLNDGTHCGRPLLSVGYGLRLEEAEGDAAFFARLPLVRNSLSHCANFYYEQWWRPDKFKFLLGGYACADAKRDIRFGELTGVNAQSAWLLTPRLQAVMGYDFGRESALGNIATSHTVNLALEVHWYGAWKENLPDRRRKRHDRTRR